MTEIDKSILRISDAPRSCSEAELLGALISGPNPLEKAHQLIEKYGTLRGVSQASAQEIAQLPGFSQLIAARIQSTLEIARRISSGQEDTCEIHSPGEVANLIGYELGLLDHEEFWVLLMNVRSKLIFIDKLYKGTVISSNIRPAEVFKTAIRMNATGIIIVHNHPSGDPGPSPDDLTTTRGLMKAGELLCINLLDHVIIGSNGKFCSLKERGMMS